MQPGREKEREIGLIFLRAKQTRTQSRGGEGRGGGRVVDRLRPLQRTRERGGVGDLEGLQEGRRQGGERERRLWATIFSTSFQQSPEQVDSPISLLALSAVALQCRWPVAWRTELFKNSDAAADRSTRARVWQSVKYGSFVMLATLH